MITKGVVLLPPHPASLLHTDSLSPMTHLAGLTIIQRILFSLHSAGVREGVILTHGGWTELARHLEEDPRTRSFVHLPLKGADEPVDGSDLLRQALAEDCLLMFPGWIAERHLLGSLCRRREPLDAVEVFLPDSEFESAETPDPVLALVPAEQGPGVLHCLERRCTPAETGRHLIDAAAGEPGRLARGEGIPVKRRQDRTRADRMLFQALVKPTESFLSKKLERSISLAISRRLLDTRVTPNMISVGSIALGLVSALFFLPEGRVLHVAGALLLLLSSIVDGCDGELARLRFQESRMGAYLDFIGDNLVHMTVFFCIGLGLYLRGEGSVYLVLGLMGTAGTLVAASAVFRRVFLENTGEVVHFETPVRGIEQSEQSSRDLKAKMNLADKISNRDFIYLILLLSAAGGLWIWAWLNGIGAILFSVYLLYLYRRMES